MQASDEVIEQICKAVPAADPGMVKAIFAAAGKTQIFFTTDVGEQIVDGKATYPDYLQVQVTSAYCAARLAQQLMAACADAISNDGKLRSPVLLVLAGEGELTD